MRACFRAGVPVRARRARRAPAPRSAAAGLVLRSPEGSESLAVPAAGDALGARLARRRRGAPRDEDAGRRRRARARSATPPAPPSRSSASRTASRARASRSAASSACSARCSCSRPRTSSPASCVAHSAPVPGVVDVGRFPSGEDALADEVAARSASRGLRLRGARRHPALAVGEAPHQPAERGAGGVRPGRRLRRAARARSAPRPTACLRAAGIAFVDATQFRSPLPGRGAPRRRSRGSRARGGSSWQSLARGDAARSRPTS